MVVNSTNMAICRDRKFIVRASPPPSLFPLYIKHLSVMLDSAILHETAKVLLSGREVKLE